MKNTILITGGAGYIGTKLVQKLVTLDSVKKVIVYDNLMYKQDGLFPFLCDPKIEFVYGDVREEKKLEKLVESLEQDMPLEKAIEDYETGMKVLRQCEEQLGQLKLRVEMLVHKKDSAKK